MRQSSFSRQERNLRRKIGKAIERYNLLEDGDKVLVALSGGKDSLVLLDLLVNLRERAPIGYELLAYTLDQGFEDFDAATIRRQVDAMGVEFVLESSPIAEILEAKKGMLDGYCSLCSRLRRGAIYSAAPRLGCNKIALGHHADDVIETLLLNLFYTGELKSMPPILTSEDGRNRVIRPLCLVYEAEIVDYFRRRGLVAVDARCPEPDTGIKRRLWMKQLLQDLEGEVPWIKNSILAGTGNVREAFLLDPRLLGNGPGRSRK